MVDESEIGLAILYSSLKVHCNTAKSSRDRKTDKTFSKLGSQTQTDSLFAMQEDESHFDAADSQEVTVTDSLALQLENRVDDLMIVIDTPEKDQGKSRLFDSTIKLREKTPTRRMNSSANATSNNTTVNLGGGSNDFEVLKDDFDFRSASKTKVTYEPQTTTRSKSLRPPKLASLFESNDAVLMDEVPGESYHQSPPTVVKPKESAVAGTVSKSKRALESSKMATQFRDQFNSEPLFSDSIDKENPIELGQRVAIKNEKVVIKEEDFYGGQKQSAAQTSSFKPSEVKREKRLVESSNLNSSSVVYSKLKPPPESIRPIKNVFTFNFIYDFIEI